MTQNKIARICWNTEGWRKPSGKIGKSRSKGTYEDLTGFGHEEWLLDTTKLIDGWHYAYLQPVGANRKQYIGKTFNISLYSIDQHTKRRWWVGLEYGFYPAANNVKKLIVVSDKPITEEAKSYLTSLRKLFHLPIHYQKYDPEKETLEETIY